MAPPLCPAESVLTVSEPTRTRSGRVSRPPERYEPQEQVEDDYSDGDYDTDESEIRSDFEDDDDEADDEDDADEYGNLDGFVVPDKSESDEDSSDGEPPVPNKARRAVTKRPGPPVRK
jgi:ribonuclease E